MEEEQVTRMQVSNTRILQLEKKRKVFCVWLVSTVGANVFSISKDTMTCVYPLK